MRKNELSTAIDWERLGGDLTRKILEDGATYRFVCKATGLSMGTLSRVANGGNVTAEVFMVACGIIEADPRDYAITR